MTVLDLVVDLLGQEDSGALAVDLMHPLLRLSQIGAAGFARDLLKSCANAGEVQPQARCIELIGRVHVRASLKVKLCWCRYLQDKDMFERFYKQHLSKRLLSGKVANEGVEQARQSPLLSHHFLLDHCIMLLVPPRLPCTQHFGRTECVSSPNAARAHALASACMQHRMFGAAACR